jgi:hypothetical protein
MLRGEFRFFFFFSKTFQKTFSQKATIRKNFRTYYISCNKIGGGAE